MSLTVEGISQAKPHKLGDRWLSDKQSARGVGRLAVRISPDGVKRFYFRYSVDGRRDAIPLGVFSKEATPGRMTLLQAQCEYRRLSALHQREESRDVRAYLLRVESEAQQAKVAEAERLELERRAAQAEQQHTLRALAAEYVTSLVQRGKARSAYDARNIFKNHLDTDPLAEKQASKIQTREVTTLLRKLVVSGHTRTAAKLRSYLRAAYAMAQHAVGDPTAPASMIAFEIESNPVADTKAFPTRQGNRTLNAMELWHYWRRLGAVTSDPIRGALQLALLLGGQRVAQLLRLRRTDVDLSGGFVTLFDPKGRRAQPRVHELPVPDEAVPILRALVERAKALGSDWLFTTDGKTPTYPGTLTDEATTIAKAMQAADECVAPFTLKDLRRTAETLMASLGISKDVRAQVQSHGLGGVQDRHYDRFDYRIEKEQALAAWARKVTTEPVPATVHALSDVRKSA